MRAAACWLELVALASASFLPRSGAGDAVSRWQLQTRDRVHWDDLHRAITQWRCDDARQSRYVTLRTPVGGGNAAAVARVGGGEGGSAGGGGRGV